MLIIDAHLDLAWNALQWNRDLRQSVLTIRAQENAAALTGPGRGMNTVALPELREGRVALCFATMLARATGTPVPHLDFRSPEQAYAIAQGQLAYYRALARAGELRILDALPTLEDHMGAWTAWEAAGAVEATPPLGVVIAMEGADPILDPAQLPEWWAAGLRVLGPVHYGPCRYGGGTGTELPLTPQGVDLLDAMAEVGMALDLTHFSDPAFRQALDRFDGPVLASHNNCRALVPHQRQFSDAQIRAIVARDGVIGVACDAWMLKLGWVTGRSTNEGVSLSDVVDHIDYICQLTGTSRHAAIGSDLDGGFGGEQLPHDLDTTVDLQRIPALLSARGYGDPDIENIMHGNWLRLLGSVLVKPG